MTTTTPQAGPVDEPSNPTEPTGLAPAGRPPRRDGFVGSVVELWAYRSLIYNLAQRDLRSRYKKSVLGWLWSLVNPAANLAIYTLVFGTILKIPPPELGNGSPGVYALYLFAGLVIWNFFSGTVTGSIAALQASGGLLNKVYFPAACPAIANMLTVLLQAFIEGAIVVVVMILMGNVAITLIIFPFLMVLVALFSLGLGLFLSVFNVRYRDVNYLVGIGMQLLFYATPLIYPLTLVPEEVKGIPLRQIIEMQPMTQFVEWSRDAFYTLEWPSPAAVAGTTLASVATFVVGWWVFSVKTRNIAEEL